MTSRSASSARSPSTCPSWSRPTASPTSRSTDIVDATNDAADELEGRGRGHRRAARPRGCGDDRLRVRRPTRPRTSARSSTGSNDDVDAIVSGHTHLAYNHSIPVPHWVDEGRAVTERPVVSAGQYGSNLNQLVFTVDHGHRRGARPRRRTHRCALKAGRLRSTANYPADPADRRTIVAGRGRRRPTCSVPQPLGEIEGPFNRAKLADGTTENRGGESTLGNLVAEVQRWATESPTTGSAQIAFMNPGGLRADMVGTTPDGYPRDADLQAGRRRPAVRQHAGQHGPHRRADQDGARAAVAATPGTCRRGRSCGWASRRASPTPTTRRGAEGVADHRHVARRRADRPGRDSYSVTVNSFLAAGGDNFGAFAERHRQARHRQGRPAGDGRLHGRVRRPSATRSPVDYSPARGRRRVPRGAPASYAPGDDGGLRPVVAGR